MMRLRSPLFAPGDQERKMAGALATAADAVILDLEDSVAPAGKDAARAASAAMLAAHAGRRIIVRVNPRGTEWYLRDLAAVVPAGVWAVMLPKCRDMADLAALDLHLEALETAAGRPVGRIGVLPIATETAAAVLALAGLTAHRRLLALCFGAEDLSADLGIPPRRADGGYPAAMAQARATILLAAAAAGVSALDTPWPDPRDPDGLAREAAAAAADGFAGKVCIHPAQIAAVNAAFTPDASRVAWAGRVRDAFAANPASGVFALDGRMIDRPHLKLAERILAAADPLHHTSAHGQ